MERKQLAPGVCITTLDASKFNRCRITLHLRFPAKRESATDAAVLALVLERGYAACPDMTALSRRLAELYGADLGVDLASAGTDRVLSADICGIKDAYALAGENLTAAYADIVFGTIFDPYLVDGAFDPEAVRIETETQARRLEAEFNSKRLYCVRQARRKFYGDTPAGIELGGSATSRLFRNVREKQSLCYYCGSAAQRATGVMMIDSGVEPGKEQQAEAAFIAELEGLKNGPITQEEVDDCRRGLLSSMDALGDSLAALENWYYGQITRGEPLYPPEYGKVLTSAVSLDEVRQTLQSYSYSVCYAVTAEPGTQGKGGSEDVE